eukprot:5325681-Pyramimonas_sp.AAC.1
MVATFLAGCGCVKKGHARVGGKESVRVCPLELFQQANEESVRLCKFFVSQVTRRSLVHQPDSEQQMLSSVSPKTDRVQKDTFRKIIFTLPDAHTPLKQDST